MKEVNNMKNGARDIGQAQFAHVVAECLISKNR